MTKRRDRKPVGRPLIPEGERRMSVGVGMTPALRRAVRQYAAEVGISQSEAAATMLNEWLHTNRADLLGGSPVPLPQSGNARAPGPHVTVASPGSPEGDEHPRVG